MDLRKIVGHRPLLQVGASIIIEDNQGRILLQLRKDLLNQGLKKHFAEL